MAYWAGTEAAVTAAEALAAALVVGQQETRDGVDLPEAEWVTARWAVPMETTTEGVWAIPAHPDVDLPADCVLVDSVSWPEE